MAADVPAVLVADDQRDVRDALRLLLKAAGYEVHCVESPSAALAAASPGRFAAALIDLNYTRDTTSGDEGLALLAALRQIDAELPVIVMTAWGSIELAVEAMRRGAGDFIEKPWDNARLATVLRTQVALGAVTRQAGRLGAENTRLRAENRLLQTEDAQPFIATAESMQPVLALIERAAPTDANVLILGENGTGKGLVARRMHARSARRDRSFVKVNMGGIAESVFESEMFGHVRGAYTDARTDRIGRFELADGGTLFLDEVANLPLGQQPKLLRVLEDGEFERLGSSRTLKTDLRVISATNADLPAEVAAGRFRKDLLYRLNTVEVRLPPLRERRADIVPLARSFLVRSAARHGRGAMHLSPAAERALESYAWPGNVRELAHVLERSVLMSVRDEIEADDLWLPGGRAAEPHARDPGAREPDAPESGQHEALTLADAEEALIREALDRCGGNILKAAEQLGLSRAALYRRLQKFGLRVPE
jgi:DNA-binding NtrC family response regulator